MVEPSERLADRRPVAETILRRVAERAEAWFPELGAAPAVGLRVLADRPRAQLYAVYLGQSRQPRVVAKVRRDWPHGVDPGRPGARPRLTSGFLTAAEQTSLEFHGLSAIHAMIDSADPHFAAIRPLDHLVDENTILMSYVDASNLRDLMVRRGRLSPRRTRAGSRSRSDVWRHVGAWLRRFQEHMPTAGLPPRQDDRADVVRQFASYGEFLARTLGERAIADIGQRGAELAADVLPSQLPVAVGHGDYAPRNVLLADDGRLTVFDPMPRWVVPRFEDLCRFLVGMRLHGLALHTHGISEGRTTLERRELEVIQGYAGGSELPMPQLRCHQLLITLDKWSALADGLPESRLRRFTRPNSASLVLASGYLRDEAGRLLALAESES